MKKYQFHFSSQSITPDIKRLQQLLLLKHPYISTKLVMSTDSKIPHLLIITSIIGIENLVKKIAADTHLEIKKII